MWYLKQAKDTTGQLITQMTAELKYPGFNFFFISKKTNVFITSWIKFNTRNNHPHSLLQLQTPGQFFNLFFQLIFGSLESTSFLSSLFDSHLKNKKSTHDQCSVSANKRSNQYITNLYTSSKWIVISISIYEEFCNILTRMLSANKEKAHHHLEIP